MGSQGSKAAKAEGSDPPGGHAAVAEPSKANGQENGHVRLNGDMTPKAGADPAPLNGTGSAEPPREDGTGGAGGEDAIEPAPPADGGEAKPEGAAAPKDTPKKKKKFSFKKSFKLSGISFRKNKKDNGDSAASSPTEEQSKAEPKAEENPASGTGPQEERGGEGQSGAEPKGEDGAHSAEEEKPPAESQGDAADAQQPPEPTGAEPAAAEQQQQEEEKE
ncbi:MARCKS-related protein [Numida meleagris]|uniref:MARCKS-related protein n=1 Tax=Numida meleagris TaxID=8996 RepID=UPI000B3DAE92|nr:MARCKS-related protein [Numida meleagris]